MNKKLYVLIQNHNYHQQSVNHVLHSVHSKVVHQLMNLIQVQFYKIGLQQRILKLFYSQHVKRIVFIRSLILLLVDDVNVMDMHRNVLEIGMKQLTLLEYFY
jgi:hypothetical protein